MSSALGTPGLSLLGSALFLLGITLFTGLSWFVLVARLGAAVSETLRRTQAYVQRRMDEFRDRKAAQAQAAVRRARKLERKRMERDGIR